MNIKCIKCKRDKPLDQFNDKYHEYGGQPDIVRSLLCKKCEKLHIKPTGFRFKIKKRKKTDSEIADDISFIKSKIKKKPMFNLKLISLAHNDLEKANEEELKEFGFKEISVNKYACSNGKSYELEPGFEFESLPADVIGIAKKKIKEGDRISITINGDGTVKSKDIDFREPEAQPTSEPVKDNVVADNKSKYADCSSIVLIETCELRDIKAVGKSDKDLIELLERSDRVMAK